MADPAGTVPPSSLLGPPPPGTDGCQRLLFSHDLVVGTYRGQTRFGLVRLIHGEDSDSEEDEEVVEEEEASRKKTGSGAGGVGDRGSPGSEPAREASRFGPLKRGYVRVQWYPEGVKQDVRETKLKLEDRSLVPRDVVRRMSTKDSQCGTVIDVNIDCVVKLVGTNCFLHPVNSKDLQHIWPIMYGDYVAYDCWLGKVYDLKNQVILKLSNGSRCSMSTEDASKLYDVCPHASDSGLFFDDSYGFYPGQELIGPAKVFSNVQWLSGVKPVLSTKSKFRVMVEEVQVTELRVTWITKSFCLGGTDSMDPPSSVITQESLPRVKRLGSFDHTQRHLGERCLCIFPSKVEHTKVLCESLEKNCLLGEVAITKKIEKLREKQIVKICTRDISNPAEVLKRNSTPVPGSLPERDAEVETMTDEQDGAQRVPATPEDVPATDQTFSNFREMFRDFQLHTEQDADDEATGDTDDTSSVTSSASSTASSQSGSGAGRKKSIPLSIRNLKRKHKKKKKNKVYREFKPGDRVAVEVITTVTTADVMWQDGSVESNIRSNELLPIQHLDNNEFCPGDFVVDKRAHAVQDPNIYGVVQSGDHLGRTCVVKWIKLNAEGDDVEVIGEEEDVSVYDIADHPDFRFRSTDIVICIGSSEPTANSDDSRPSVGQVARVDVSSKVEVIWADNSRSIVLPQHLYNVESELEESFYDSVDSSSSGASSDEWEDDSDSWETDNALTEDELLKSSVDEASAAQSESTTAEQAQKPAEDEAEQNATAAAAVVLSLPGLAEKVAGKEGIAKSFKELKEAIKILESLKNMTVEQLLTGSPTSPTVEPEKFTREKKFLDDIKKLQENLKKTLDNVAIVEEEKMESAPEAEREDKAESQAQARSEWPSDTPVLCQQSGGKPGVIFTSAKGEVFSVLDSAPESHAFKKLEFQPPEAKKFFSTVRKEMALLATSLPDGIMVKTFEDRMDLFSAFIKGSTRTPYEDGLFLFDIQLPNIYPAVPPLFRYLSQCSGRLNPNLYDNGKVCVSLLGTWIGKGTERWTSKSSLLQVLISIQGLILVNEPYYNEAGFDSDRGLQEGYENSRCYNEMALIRVVQSMTQLLRKPVEVFEQEIREHFQANGWRLVHRIETWLETNSIVEKGGELSNGQDHPCIVPYSPTEPDCTPDPTLDSKDLDDSGCGASTLAPGDTQQYSDSESTGKGMMAVSSPVEEHRGAVGGGQPSVKPKKRRKSYRSFLPDKRGYPDIGFPLFPLSKGFIKSMHGVLRHYRASLLEAGILEPREGKLSLPL
ncbi:(E3-independent) E2 ubiquitin-conjugating enzyme isoform X2 [Bombina bombina]|uniref:(E3-independent) E2 ubiquitin-conjugating enzyme isoform X2 n=1 Tax=Bombina bombina TaxID=8345 RepID=UPI00235AAC72|nr:(E3-independent) E2 ubiquitin-conjugating enzyme isoform X2 [Bombina bombina]